MIFLSLRMNRIATASTVNVTEMVNQGIPEAARVIKFKDGHRDSSMWIMIPLFPLEEYVGTLVIENIHVI